MALHSPLGLATFLFCSQGAGQTLPSYGYSLLLGLVQIWLHVAHTSSPVLNHSHSTYAFAVNPMIGSAGTGDMLCQQHLFSSLSFILFCITANIGISCILQAEGWGSLWVVLSFIAQHWAFLHSNTFCSYHL